MKSGPAEQFERVEALFHRATSLGDGERRAFVAAEAGGDAALERDVLALLDADGRTHSLLDAPKASALPSGMRIGPYAIERVIGAGGMATVYLARRADRQFEKQVAIKLVNQGLAAEIAGTRFQTEREILARLEHPNIARLLDAGVTEFGQPYLVMEWIDGVTLDLWASAEPPSRDRCLDLWLAIAAAVSYAHRNLCIHRDLKPSNVLVDRDGVAKLLDFGIAKLVEGGPESTTRTIHYTPKYASPEQIHGRAVTTATDIYGLGLLLYELIVGARGGSGDVRVPASVPPDLAAIIQMALREEPERRYPTADAFAEDVQRFRRGLPVSAQPESVGYQLRRFVGRHRTAVTAAVVVAASLVALTATALWQARRANVQRARAEEITDYITGFLGATPTGADWALRDRGAGLRVVDLANLIADRLDAGGTQPDTEAALRYVLAMVYFQTGDIARADRHGSRALAMYESMAAPTDPRRLSAEALRGAIDNALGRFADAERRERAVRDRWPNPPPSARSAIAENLGLAQFRLGQTDAAERTFRDGIAALERTLGADNRNIGLLRSDLALVAMERGQFAQAASELERAVAIARAQAKGASIGLAWSLVNLSACYRFLGRLDDSLAAATEAHDRMREVLGPEHFSLVHSLVFIAYVKAMQGQPDAESFARRAMAVQASLPPDHYERAVSLTCLGFVLLQQGRVKEAEAALATALEIRRKRFTPPNWRIAETAGLLGEARARLGDAAGARALFDDSVDTFVKVYGEGNPRTVEAKGRRERWTR